MKKLIILIVLVSAHSLSVYAQDTLAISIAGYKLDSGKTYSWRGTDTYYDMTSWQSAPYTQGHLKDQYDQFVMNYRLLFPNQGNQPGYDPNYSPGYPLIVMMHGAGERGNCWNNSCYQPPATYDPLTPPSGTDQRLLNNDHNLVHGGQPHLNAVNLAGTKKPEDPLLNNRAFPGYVLFPQNLNGWVGVNDVRHAIRIVRLLVKRYNIDPNRIYIHGLSNGGYGTTMAVHEAPWLFAAAAPMSGIAVSTALDARPNAYEKISTVPFWFFQGGRDTNPYPSETETLITKIREEGGITRYKIYPTLGHGVWNNAYNEPDFFTWLLSKNRANIHVDFDNPNICGTNGAGASLRLPAGFPAYQWERDGQIIPGATSSAYVATIAGVYRARFSRTHANPTEQQWNRWSDPVSISEKTPPKPELNQLGTILLTDLNNNNRLVLTAADNTQVNYHWYKDNVLLAQQGSVLICEFGCSKGVYELRTSGFDNCPSPPSDKKYAYFSSGFGDYVGPNAAPVNITTPSQLAGSLTSSNSAFITWRDNSTNERGFELWRRKSTDGTFTWAMVALTGEDITTYHDTGLEPNTTYLYKVRAVSNYGRSFYAPSNDRNSTNYNPINNPNYLVISTTTNNAKPAPLQNVTATPIFSQPPIAFAGPNRTVRLTSGVATVASITLDTRDIDLDPANDNATLNVDPDGYIAKYEWRQVSGPTVTLLNTNTSALVLQNVPQGTYVFGLKTTDNEEVSDLDFVTLNVVPFNGSRVTLTGSSGSCNIRLRNVNYLASFSSNLTQTATNFVSTHSAALLAQGITVSSQGAILSFTNYSATVQNVSGNLNGTLSTFNQAPVVNGGTDRVIIYGQTTSINLSGYSSDPDNNISTRTWTMVSGPNTTTLNTSSGTGSPLTRSVSGFIPGTYVFRFTVTDSEGAISYDDVTVDVVPPLNALSVVVSWDPGPANAAAYWVHFGGDSVSTFMNTNSHAINYLPPNKYYNFSVKVVDQLGNISPASEQVTASTYYSGLKYQHSTGVWINASGQAIITHADLTWQNPEFSGTIDNFNINSPDEDPPGVRTQADFFNFRYDGFFYAHTAGNYRFQIVSNEVARLSVDGISRVTIGTGNDQSQINTSGNVSLSVGPHRITVDFVEYLGDHELIVRYDLPGGSTTYVEIPTNRIRSYDLTLPTPPSPPTPPTNFVATGVSMTQNNLSWTAPSNGSAYKVVVLGSSTAAGTGANPSSNSWVNRFTTWLQGVAPGSTVTNLAVSGYSTRDVMPTLSPSPATPKTANNITAALALSPNFIIVNLPSNDTNLGIPLGETMANFATIKDAADAQGVKIFFTTTQPRNFGNLSLRDELQTQANLIRSEFGDYVIDIYDELTDFGNDKAIKGIYDSGDGIHVNNAGHEYIFNTTRDKLIPVLTNYEVFRALEEAGPYTMITRTSVTSLEDINLLPGTTHWYQVRTVDFNGASGFSSIDSATTHTDNQPPTAPTGVTITSSTFSTVSLVWNASTDNVGVTGYEVYANGNLIGSTDIIGILITDLSPGTTYNFTVLAVDASGNKSGLSTVVSTTTPAPAVYYSTPTGNLNLTSNWGTASNGTGTNPPGFDFNGTHYVVSNRTTSSLGGSWTVEGAISKVVVPDNVTLTADNAFTARVEVQGNGQVILENTIVPTFIALSNNSTIQYNAASGIQQNNYGNLSLGGSGTKTFSSGTTTVNGDLTVGNNIGLKGGPENSTLLKVAGDITINGTPQFVADDFGIKLELTGTGTKTISSAGDLYLDEIITSGASTVNVISSGSPYNIRLGGETSGGLTLVNGSKLNIGNNTLLFTKQAAVNTNNETGRIGINGGNILFTSTSALSSNLYFDPAANAINRFEVDLSGAGNIVVREFARVTDGLKIRRGVIDANAQLMLVSTALKTANLEMIENNGQVTGDLIVQRHMEPEERIWKYISTPVEGVTVADWQQSGLPITGNFTGASTGPGLGSSPSLYYYNNGWVAYPSPQPGGSNNAPIQRGVGYSAFVRNELTPTVLQVSGNPFQHDIPFTLTGGSGGDTGWNLLGNPYASTIVWNNTSAWTSSGINSTISVRNNPNGQLLIWDAATGIGNLPGGKIAPGQAFWVQATSANPSLTITEQAKTVDQQEFYREGSDQEYAIVKLVRGSLEDPAFILFNTTSDSYEANADAYKRLNEGMFSLSTLTSDGVPVAINKLNETFCSKTLNLKFENVSPGQYKLVVENITSLSRIQQVVLRDNLLNTTVSNDAEYTFEITSDPATFSIDRFTLTFQRSEMVMPVFVSASSICAEDFSTILLANTEYGTSYSVINHANEVIAGPFVGAGATTTLQIPAEALVFGTNELRVQVLDAVCDGAPVILPAEINVMRNSRPEVSVSNYQTICEGSSATLTAIGAAGTISYLWTNQSGETLGNSNVLTIPVVHDNSYFNVAAIGPNGCVGEAKSIIVLTESLDVPEIISNNDTLFTTHSGKLQWFKDGEPLFNETRNYFVPLETGTYQVRATSASGGCTRTSDDIIFVVTATEPVIGGIYGLEVFPNPAAQEQVTVIFRTSEQVPVELKLVDTFGRTVYQQQHSSSEAQRGIYINANQPLAIGLYLVIGTQGNASMTKRLIIK